ncbi:MULTISPECIES: hypothetical protein [Streptomyces]|uniref:Lipoprotein n=1 Tax=Streptomyces thermogriseus TaxID=75292 RepID=A0ABN1T2E3_9ACTN
MRQHPEQSQQPQPGRTGRPLLAARRTRGTLLAAALVLVPLATACDGGADDAAVNSAPSRISAPQAGVVAPAKVEVIARLTGCTPDIRIEAEQLRQGVCHTPEIDYLITTFPKEEYKQVWLDSAAVYGGHVPGRPALDRQREGAGDAGGVPDQARRNHSAAAGHGPDPCPERVVAAAPRPTAARTRSCRTMHPASATRLDLGAAGVPVVPCPTAALPSRHRAHTRTRAGE